jgi:hypothetical protein
MGSVSGVACSTTAIELALTALVLGSCAPAPAPSAPAPLVAEPVPVVVPSADPEPVASDASAPALAAPLEVVEPASAACRVSSAAWSQNLLRLSENGQPFASASNAPATLVFGSGDEPTSAVAVLDDGKLVLRFVLLAKETRLFTRTPLPIAGFLIPEARHSLDWKGGVPGKLRVGVDGSFLLESPQPVVDEVACDRLAISPGSFDARASVTGRQKLVLRSVAHAAAPLATTPGGDAVARVRDGVEVGVLDRSGKFTRVLIEGDEYWVVGWMATTDLSAQPSPLGRFGHGYGAGRGMRAGRVTATVCDQDVDVFAELGSERAKIGTMRRGTPFRKTEEGDRVAVDFLNRWLWLKPGAKLWVPAAAVADCGTRSVSY